MFKVPPGFVTGNGTQVGANRAWSSTDQGGRKAIINDAFILHSCLLPTPASNEGEASRRAIRNLGALSSTISDAVEGEVPHGQSMMFDADGESNLEGSKVVLFVAGEVIKDKKGSW